MRCTIYAQKKNELNPSSLPRNTILTATINMPSRPCTRPEHATLDMSLRKQRRSHGICSQTKTERRDGEGEPKTRLYHKKKTRWDLRRNERGTWTRGERSCTRRGMHESVSPPLEGFEAGSQSLCAVFHRFMRRNQLSRGHGKL